MDSSETRDEIVGLIYDAAVQPTRWQQVIEGLADHLRCTAGGVVLYNADGQSADLLVQARLDPFYLKLLAEEYLPLLPELRVAPVLPLGTVTATTVLQPPEVFHKSRFYNEWVSPQRHRDALCVVVHRDRVGSVLLHLMRGERVGYVTAAEMARAQGFVPHLMRAVRLGLQLERLSSGAHARDQALHGLAAAIMLVDAAGRIVFANQAAEEMLRVRDGFTAMERVLHAKDPVADRVLRDAIARASTRDGAAMRAGDVVVPRADRRSLLLSVTPLSPQGGEVIGVRGQATAVIVANDPEQQAWPRIETVARAYGLTAGETRLLAAIVEGVGIEAAADRLGIGRATAKTHLQRIFQKTFTSRQGELIRLVATSMPPLL